MSEEKANGKMVQVNGHELVPVEETTDLVVEPDVLEAYLTKLEKAIPQYKRLVTLAYKLTNEKDWVLQDGVPYLQASGAEKLCGPFQVAGPFNVHSYRLDREDEHGKYYIWVYEGEFRCGVLGGRTLHAVGKKSSRNKFFAMKHGELRPLSEIKEEDVMLSAYTNLTVNGFTRLLGIRNPRMEELKEAGLDISKLQSVQYEKKATKTQTPEERKRATELADWLIEMSEGDKARAAVLLEQLTEFTTKDGKKVAGVKSAKQLTGKRLDIAHGKVKARYEEWQRALQEASGGEEALL